MIMSALLSKRPEQKPAADPDKKDNLIQLAQGRLTPEQINLMLKHLPVDITFVDENNRVCYYSDTPQRIFKRSPAVIGQEVQNCHPAISVHVVNDIVAKFKAKERDVAEFWIKLNNQFVYIRYFPVYDADGKYKGIVEVSQEISRIINLEGERRLLDW